jgi:hypothetical protein
MMDKIRLILEMVNLSEDLMELITFASRARLWVNRPMTPSHRLPAEKAREASDSCNRSLRQTRDRRSHLNVAMTNLCGGMGNDTALSAARKLRHVVNVFRMNMRRRFAGFEQESHRVQLARTCAS